MTTTLSTSASSLSPETVTGWTSTREANNLIHTIIGRADPDVTMKPAGLRTGTLEMLFLTLPLALAAESLHAGEGVLHLQDSDHAALEMYYVASGAIELELDDETRSLWLLRVDFQEVLP